MNRNINALALCVAITATGLFAADSAWLQAAGAFGNSTPGREGNWKSSTQGSPSLDACRQRVSEKPDEAVAHNDLGWALRQQGNLKEAESSLREAIRLNPSMPQAHSNLSVVLQDGGKSWPEALEEARKSVSLDPQQPVYLVVLGNALAGVSQFKDAETAYRSAIKLRPDYENAYYNLGRALHLNGQNVEAQQELSVALGLDPSDERVIQLLDSLFKNK